jgi:hypothetical protein
MPKQRTPTEIFFAAGVLRMLLSEGYELFPLAPHSKRPRDEGFLLHDYAGFDWSAHLTKGGGSGVRARRCDLFMDVDPKNGGLDSFKALQWDVDNSFEGYPLVHTGRGNGGFHVYMRLPVEAGARWRWHVKEYPGIDFQTLGRYVVAPGTLHPDTGKPYVLQGPHMAFLTECKRMAPPALLTLLRKPPRVISEHRGGGEITCEELARLLALLPAESFGQGGEFHGEWLDIAMAAHHGTSGEGIEEWLDWCATDPTYGDDARALNAARWDSFDSSRPDGVTYKTLLMAVTRAGHRREVARLHTPQEVKDDFDNDAASYLDGDSY